MNVAGNMDLVARVRSANTEIAAGIEACGFGHRRRSVALDHETNLTAALVRSRAICVHFDGRDRLVSCRLLVRKERQCAGACRIGVGAIRTDLDRPVDRSTSGPIHCERRTDGRAIAADVLAGPDVRIAVPRSEEQTSEL